MKGDISVNSGICKNVRKANYDRGLKYGNKVLHGSDLRDLVGLTVSDVNSNADDEEVVVWFESNEFYREEIARILSGIEDNDILKYVYVIVSDIEGEK